MPYFSFSEGLRLFHPSCWCALSQRSEGPWHDSQPTPSRRIIMVGSSLVDGSRPGVVWQARQRASSCAGSLSPESAVAIAVARFEEST